MLSLCFTMPPSSFQRRKQIRNRNLKKSREPVRVLNSDGAVAIASHIADVAPRDPQFVRQFVLRDPDELQGKR